VPKLISETEIKLEWTDIEAMVPKVRVDSGKRSSGVHLSGVIKYVLTTAGLLDPDDITDEMPLRMAVGMAWEAFVVGLWPDLIWQPGEVCQDDIYGSPDGITPIMDENSAPERIVTGRHQLEEFKATWRSRLEKSELKGIRPPDRKITEQRAWMLQVGGYCHMMGLRRARLHVLWIMGDYRGSGPQYFTYLVEFSDSELERVWKNMLLPNVEGAIPESH
jgi:hypothetical protein